MGENLKITFWRESGLSSAGPTLASAGCRTDLSKCGHEWKHSCGALVSGV